MEPSLAETVGATARANVAAAKGERAMDATSTHERPTTNSPPKDLKRPVNLGPEALPALYS